MHNLIEIEMSQTSCRQHQQMTQPQIGWLAAGLSSSFSDWTSSNRATTSSMDGLERGSGAQQSCSHQGQAMHDSCLSICQLTLKAMSPAHQRCQNLAHFAMAYLYNERLSVQQVSCRPPNLSQHQSHALCSMMYHNTT